MSQPMSCLHPPEHRHARADVRSHHDSRLTAANGLACQAPGIFPGRDGSRTDDRSRLSALRLAENDAVCKIEQESILVEDRKRVVVKKRMMSRSRRVSWC